MLSSQRKEHFCIHVFLNRFTHYIISLIILSISGYSNLSLAQPYTQTVTFCLDFDGHHIDRWIDHFNDVSNVDIPAFNHRDSDPSTLDLSEQVDVDTIIDIVREDFSPFKVNVLSEEPPTDNGETRESGCEVEWPNQVDLRIVVGGHRSDFNDSENFNAAAYAVNGSFNSTNPNIPSIALVFIYDGLGKERILPAWRLGNAASHEAGHALNLFHQAQYDQNGFVQEYAPGTPEVSPIMGDYLPKMHSTGEPIPNTILKPQRTTWTIGPTPYLVDDQGTAVHSDRRPAFIQDDMRIIASQTSADLPDLLRCISSDAPANCVPRIPNRFGYKQDDHGNYGGRATSFSIHKSVGSRPVKKGIIERPSDVDYFSFVIPQSMNSIVTVRATVNVQEDVTNLVPRIDIRNYTDTKSVVSNQTDSTVATEKLVPGAYLIRVSGHGRPGDTGQYEVALSINSGPYITHHQLFKDHLRVTFNERIDSDSFTAKDVLIEYGDGSRKTIDESKISISPVIDTTRTYDINFPPYSTMGGIRFVIGPKIENLRKVEMDQNGDGSSTVSDNHKVEDLIPPRVTSIAYKTDRIEIKFSEPLNPATVNQQTVRVYDILGQPFVNATALIETVDERTFNYSMTSYPVGGIRLHIGSDITDSFGNHLVSTKPFTITEDQGPRVIDTAFLEDEYLPGIGTLKQSAFLVAFDSTVNPDTLEQDGISIKYLSNAYSGIRINNDVTVKIKDIVKVDSSRFPWSSAERLWLVNFDKVGYGTYELKVNRTVTDLFHNMLDQDKDGVNGELQDTYIHRFNIQPRVDSNLAEPTRAYILASQELLAGSCTLSHRQNQYIQQFEIKSLHMTP